MADQGYFKTIKFFLHIRKDQKQEISPFGIGMVSKRITPMGLHELVRNALLEYVRIILLENVRIILMENVRIKSFNSGKCPKFA